MTLSKPSQTTLYLDSSALVALLFNEPKRCESIRTEIESALDVVTSELALLEVQSALCVAAKGDLDRQRELEAHFHSLMTSIGVFQMHSTAINVAWALVKRYRRSPGLRPMDAIHLATFSLIARDSEPSSIPGGVTPIGLFVTCDRQQHEAALLENLPSRLLA